MVTEVQDVKINSSMKGTGYSDWNDNPWVPMTAALDGSSIIWPGSKSILVTSPSIAAITVKDQTSYY